MNEALKKLVDSDPNMQMLPMDYPHSLKIAEKIWDVCFREMQRAGGSRVGKKKTLLS